MHLWLSPGAASVLLTSPAPPPWTQAAWASFPLLPRAGSSRALPLLSRPPCTSAPPLCQPPLLSPCQPLWSEPPSWFICSLCLAPGDRASFWAAGLSPTHLSPHLSTPPERWLLNAPRGLLGAGGWGAKLKNRGSRLSRVGEEGVSQGGAWGRCPGFGKGSKGPRPWQPTLTPPDSKQRSD